MKQLILFEIMCFVLGMFGGYVGNELTICFRRWNFKRKDKKAQKFYKGISVVEVKAGFNSFPIVEECLNGYQLIARTEGLNIWVKAHNAGYIPMDKTLLMEEMQRTNTEWKFKVTVTHFREEKNSVLFCNSIHVILL